MKEFKVGERITLEVQESDSCDDCFFKNNMVICANEVVAFSEDERSDGKNVIFKLVEPKK